MAIPIDIPTAHQNETALISSIESDADPIFTPADSLSTSLGSTSTIDIVLEDINIGEDHVVYDANARTWNASSGEQDLCGTKAALDEATAVAFGKGPDRWLYHPNSGYFDLCRRSPAKVLIPSHDEHMSGIVIDPSRTLIVIVDMQNYFVHPACYPHAAGLAAVQPILNVMDQSRRLGIQIGFLNWVIEEKDLEEMPPAVQRGWSMDRLKSHGVGWHVNLGSELPDGQGRCLWKDSWNAELYGPIQAAVRPEDAIFLKNRPSGMWSNDCDMARFMTERNMKTILFAGVNSDQCVLGTLTDSYSKSYDCLLVRDCVGTATTGLMAQELVEWNVARNYGFVVQSNDVLEARHLEI